MRWYSIGPGVVAAPRNADYRRVSSRNLSGVAAKVDQLVVAESDPDTLTVVTRPWVGNAAAFLSNDGGLSWAPISDTLQTSDPHVDPACIAVHPRDPTYLVMGTRTDAAVYVSTDAGRRWGAPSPVGPVNALLIDPRPAAVGSARVYAATASGLLVSTDGGRSFSPSPVLSGDVRLLVGDFTSGAEPNVFAGVWGAGIWHAHHPLTPAGWQQISGGAGGLPSPLTAAPDSTVGVFDRMLITLCPNAPGRTYVWLFYPSTAAHGRHKSRSLWTAGDPRGTWTMVPAATLPDPSDWYCAALAASPASPGDGDHDLLVFTAGPHLERSVDGGRTWQIPDNDLFHDDYHALAFTPPRSPVGGRTALMVGCDGGVGKSAGWADPSYDITRRVTSWDEGSDLDGGTSFRHLNSWYVAQSQIDVASPPGAPALSYGTAADTGNYAGDANRAWRHLGGADSGGIVLGRRDEGVVLWYANSAYPGSWPDWGRLLTITDTGEFRASEQHCALDGALLAVTGHPALDASGAAIYAVNVRAAAATLTSRVAGAGVATVAVSSTVGISVGSTLVVAPLAPDQELVTVTGNSRGTITARFAQPHPSGTSFQVQRNIVVRLPARTPTVASLLLDDLHDGVEGRWLAAHPTDPNVLYLVRAGNSPSPVWRTTTAGGPTTWTPVTSGGVPTGGPVTSISVGPTGRAFVLFDRTVSNGAEVTADSPLWEVSGGSWTSQPCTGLPPVPPGTYGQIVCDPVSASTLYLTSGSKVFRLRLSNGSWSARDISEGLTGRTLALTTAVDVGTPGRAHVVLRATAPSGGVWERDADDIPDHEPQLFMRGNVLDVGFLRPMPERLAGPWGPGDVWHYQSPDVVLDAEQSSAGRTWHQNDPEYSTPPLDPVVFGQLRDNSQQLPGHEPARVHVQVHNRSSVPASNVWVWAIAAPAAAGLPSLFRSPSHRDAFDFWRQFVPGGGITPSLPADSPWVAVGAPQRLPRVSAERPAVASWEWEVPRPPDDHPLHYCIAVFVHSARSPIGLTTGSVDEAATASTQVAQKNLHIMPVLAGGG